MCLESLLEALKTDPDKFGSLRSILDLTAQEKTVAERSDPISTETEVTDVS